jgi:amino acid permease
LTYFPAVLAFISTIVGGGVVGIPYAFYYLGIPIAIVLNILIAFFTVYSCYLYLLAKDFSGGHQ